MSAVDTTRLIALRAVHNFRDLGGYETTDGRVTRWRTLYRADGLNRLAGEDLEAVRGLDLHTVIDLRTEGEITERGRFPVDLYPVSYQHLSLMDVMWDPAEAPDADGSISAFLLGKYLEMIATAEPRIAQAFRVLAMPGALPAVFHCAAGKDRTGILAALLLSTLGVPDHHVVADYELTSDAFARMQAWVQDGEPELAKMLAAQPAAFLAADPAAMEGMLALIVDAHGSTREYVRGLGVEDDVLATLEHALLDVL